MDLAPHPKQLPGFSCCRHQPAASRLVGIWGRIPRAAAQTTAWASCR